MGGISDLGLALLRPLVVGELEAEALLTQEVLDQMAEGIKVNVRTMAALMLYPWPGGEEELKEGLQTAIIKARGKRIDRVHLPKNLAEALPRPPEQDLLLWFSTETECRFLTWCIRHSGLNKVQLARELGITRSALYKKLDRYGIEYKREA